MSADGKIIDLLTANGLKLANAKVLACFKDNERLTVTQITILTGMQQPQVSTILGEMERAGWTHYDESYVNSRGRPFRQYRLVPSFKEVIRIVADNRADELRADEENLIELMAAAV